MLKLALLALLAAAAHAAGTYTCSLQVGAKVITPTVTLPNSCSASSGGLLASARPGQLLTRGSYSAAVVAEVSMVDSITISGGTGTATLAYRVRSDCSTAAGWCIGDGAGWRLVQFTYGQPIPITLALKNGDNSRSGTAMLGVSIKIDAATVLKPGTPRDRVGDGPAFFDGKFSVPGAFISSGWYGLLFVQGK